jgi:ankyrin repeat protein
VQIINHLKLHVYSTTSVFITQLNDEERLYLSAAALGDVPIIRQSLEEAESSNMNVNCVDYMGRSALHLAVDSENMEAIELLLDKLNFESTEEALLHAISKGATKIVKVKVLCHQAAVT